MRASLAGPRFPVCRDADCSTAGKSDLVLTLEVFTDLPGPSSADFGEEYERAYDALENAYIEATS